ALICSSGSWIARQTFRATPPTRGDLRRDSGEVTRAVMPDPPKPGTVLRRSHMTSASLLTDAFGRVRETVYDAVMGLTAEQLAFRPYPAGNSIAWLVWHLTRVQDDHVAGVAETRQVWESGESGEWAPRFGLPAGSMDTGYGNTSEQVAAIIVESPD